MVIWYVHGAGASERSFVWLQQQLPAHTARFFGYTANQRVTTLIERCAACLVAEPNVILVGHSLGGIIATACAQLANVSKLVTLCAPFGGIRYADMLSLFSFDPLISDLRSYSAVLSGIRATRLPTPHLSIVGTQGLPFINESNDGVISVASQTALRGPRYQVVPHNHFEVLLSVEVAALITSFMAEPLINIA